MIQILENKEGAKGKIDFLYFSHVIMECNISTRTSLTLK
jgi:hypothetical protein